MARGARGRARWGLAGAEVVCGEAGVLVPPLRPEPRALPRWILPGATADYLTQAGALHGALVAFAGGPHGA
ncbi:hypothetical protein RM780_02695 [Streptomyces sp. DSM 44917]|uniref:Uncharacterized protein n=1 Tax=Streptomyces boetiae TaxID=3075541 RepID=A0ABU2L2S4_9ACTN|nr:hypothetical protein [Streptomyces sp. DSM 44917]MDT0305871.1 hypothetical protein [Streptomyces sp. DSM 44917]